MEWKRAITILIVSFIVLNIFMVFHLWFKGQPTIEFTLTQDQKTEIMQTLKQKNIAIKTDIPKEGRPQALLEISSQKLDEQKILKGFFGKEAVWEMTRTQDGRSYTFNNQQLIITENGFITYFNNEEQIIWPNLTKEKAEKEARDFMNSCGGMPEGAVLDMVTYDERSEGYLLEYVRCYDDFFIENSYITIIVTSAGVKTYYQCWLNPLKYAGKKRGVISPLTALMRVITEIESEDPVEITGIRQGYYSKLYDANQWQAAPVWRIQLGDSDTYYVNAYTGEMEQ